MIFVGTNGVSGDFLELRDRVGRVPGKVASGQQIVDKRIHWGETVFRSRAGLVLAQRYVAASELLMRVGKASGDCLWDRPPEPDVAVLGAVEAVVLGTELGHPPLAMSRSTSSSVPAPSSRARSISSSAREARTASRL